MFEEAPTWTPKEPLHFHFFNHLESSRDLRWGFMSNLFQGVSSKMDVLKVPLRFNTESEKQDFLQIFSFFFSAIVSNTGGEQTPRSHVPLHGSDHFQAFPPPHNPQWHNKTAERQAGRPSGLIFSHWWTPHLWSSHRDPYLASLLPSLWETTNSPVSKTSSLLPRRSARHQTAWFFWGVFYSPYPFLPPTI